MPADVEQPTEVSGYVVTFWDHYPQNVGRALHATDLAPLLRQLHQLPAPPVDLEPYRPLQTLAVAAETSPSLQPDDRVWLLDRRAELLDAFHRLDFPWVAASSTETPTPEICFGTAIAYCSAIGTKRASDHENSTW